jgi:hypothetical protein
MRPAAKESTEEETKTKGKGLLKKKRTLKGTRKCVTSRAYHDTIKQYKEKGKRPSEIIKAAPKADHVVGLKWDKDHAK